MALKNKSPEINRGLADWKLPPVHRFTIHFWGQKNKSTYPQPLNFLHIYYSTFIYKIQESKRGHFWALFAIIPIYA
ncbi:MAG: hypothetical protein A2481_02700 [Candidatus Yonathbacteria bacterium RIFOXYC2_FULL_47_9]|nr:MAG: hypothetical protein A2481_02700 [Candidatus Yonathbacteria bacterium RIFOXYC2_FULL_47_9]HAT68326.1 hypothetical protein [Candidatus Yonathbacteria bacterium]